LNTYNNIFGIDSNGENGILIFIEEEEENEETKEGMRYKLDSNE